MIKTRVRLLDTGVYVAEHNFLKFFWCSCFYNYGWSGEATRKPYDTEEKAEDACIQYCTEQKDIRIKAQAARSYTPKEITCKE